MSQIDLFTAGLSEQDAAQVDAVCRFAIAGRYMDARIEAMHGAHDTTDEDVRQRFSRLATALIDARDWVRAWDAIARLMAAA